MKSANIMIVFILVLSLTACMSNQYPAKNPENISFYTPKQEPRAAYRVIGVASVSKYNFLGKERNQDLLKQQMRVIAAAKGGDGLINYNSNDKSANANIIAFQKILI